MHCKKSIMVIDGKISETQQIRMICSYTVKKLTLFYISNPILVQYIIVVKSPYYCTYFVIFSYPVTTQICF